MSDRHDPHSATMVLDRVAPAWGWLRKNFSLASVLTIATVIAGAVGIISNLRTRVVVLETRVIPVLKDEGAVTKLQDSVEDVKARVSRLEKNWDDAANTAGTAPYPRKGAHP